MGIRLDPNRSSGGLACVETIQEKKIYTPSLKKVLRGRVCDKVVSEQETTLGLLGLMKESNNFLRKFKGEGALPYPI
jgi:hypothetical protein